MKNPDGTVKAAEATRAVYEFAGFRLDSGRRVLERAGHPIALYPRAFDTLQLLVERNNQLLPKDELMARLWPGLVVEENSLARVISDLRKALGDSANCIVTVARRGYRLDADVRTIERTAPPAAAGAKALAVLPFSAMGGTEDDKRLSFGMADALITRLSRIKEITVRPTTSITRYLDTTRSPGELGRELRADVVLCGSVRRSTAQVRVTVQLIDVATEAALWAEKFDEAPADIFAIEDSISARVADALAPELTGQERRSLSQRATQNAEAYDLYLRGRFWLSRRTGESIRKAIECFERAVLLDPQYALAHASIAEAYAFLSIASATVEAMPPREVVPLALAAARRALGIDDRLSEAHAVLGHSALNFDWDWPAAEAHLQRAISLKPHNPHARQFYSMGLASLGRTAEALAELRIAREIDPTSVIIRANIGFTLYRARRFNEAVEELRGCVALAPDSAYARYRLVQALQESGRYEDALEQCEAMLQLPGAQVQALVCKANSLAGCGRAKEARECLERLHALARERYVSAFFIAEIHASLGEAEEAIRWLERAYEERAVPMISLQVNPKLDRLRTHAGFQAIVRRMRLWDAQPDRQRSP
ncbi:MAG TPA: tetratricopeptide repeat protein [Steroidobacteraceae bacterium]|nr:tetratricopeptide repeat protein [Steroidobacteraceae bacterium]